MREYMALGIDRFILSGYPHLEECYRFAELVFPLLPLKAGKLRASGWRPDRRGDRECGAARCFARCCFIAGKEGQGSALDPLGTSPQTPFICSVRGISCPPVGRPTVQRDRVQNTPAAQR
ncbi:MAG: hypothetical protein WDN04_18680 [Rhodospirillales bacterium]